MAQTIKLKRSSQADSSGIPSTNQLELGEVAINTYHGKMYIKKSNTGGEAIVLINPDNKTPVVNEYFITRNLSLNTTSTTMSRQVAYKAPDYDDDHAVEVEVNVDVKYQDGVSGYSVVNDIEFYLQVRGRSGTVGINTHNFTATHVANTTYNGTQIHRISFAGDITKYIGDATTMGTSATTSGYDIKTPIEYYYDPSVDKTFVTYDRYFGAMFSSGTQTVYFSLNGFSAVDTTWRTVKTIFLDQLGNDYAFNLHRSESVKVKIGVVNQGLDYRLQARETSTQGENAIHSEHRIKITGVPV